MQVKEAHHHGAHAHDHRRPRVERREMERETAKTHKRTAGRGIGRYSFAIGLAIILLAMSMFGYLAFRQATVTTSAPVRSAPPMVDRTALDPAIALIKVGRPAPDFTVKTVTGQSVALSLQRGHPVLLEFFASWCPVCHREAPIIHQLTTSYANRGLSTLAVLANPYGRDYEISRGQDLRIVNKGDLLWYSRTYQANYPLLVDKHFWAVNRYGAGSYPTLYLIDSAGKVAFAHQGALPFKSLAPIVDRLVSTKK